MPTRTQLLHNWLSGPAGLTSFTLKPASGDASFRRYFRVSYDGKSRIVMDAPPEQEDCRPFVAIAQRLRAAGLNVPTVHHQDLEQGFLLLDDLGSILYLDVLDEDNADQLYGDAMQALVVIQGKVSGERLPLYDRALLLQEMELFREWLVQKHLRLELSAKDQDMLDQVFDVLADSALEQPCVCVHRDYHSRNLMRAEPNPGILDFQDAVYGPVTYDLVSLLRDCYIRWPVEQVENWAMRHFKLAVQNGVLDAGQEADFLPWFDLMGAQRQLKAAGIFARLNQRDGKSGYLMDIPRTLGYIVDIAPRYPELCGLASLITDRVLPKFDYEPVDK
ncbi:Phosphotransferase involved in threonylcarbamoyladenosine t(6)A37 formation in tRNA [hydrothermal vent metagenome]|uniref:Phosphotransferase involved in threonylcarbamoyladenosine t(6)A37 formation in tRNA n=1 Tax=hydrothermal vent metagenome TaxID=652676 RepID=A0A3B1AQW5_9ZZZZ